MSGIRQKFLGYYAQHKLVVLLAAAVVMLRCRG